MSRIFAILPFMLAYLYIFIIGVVIFILKLVFKEINKRRKF